MGEVYFMYSSIGESINSKTSIFYYMDFLSEAVVIQEDDRIVYFNTSFINLINLHEGNKIIGQNFYALLGIDKKRLQNIDSNGVIDIELKSIEIENFNRSALDVEIKSSLKKNISLSGNPLNVVNTSNLIPL